MRYEDNIGFCVGFAGFLFPIDIRMVKCSADNKMALVGQLCTRSGLFRWHPIISSVKS